MFLALNVGRLSFEISILLLDDLFEIDTHSSYFSIKLVRICVYDSQMKSFYNVTLLCLRGETYEDLDKVVLFVLSGLERILILNRGELFFEFYFSILIGAILDIKLSF